MYTWRRICGIVLLLLAISPGVGADVAIPKQLLLLGDWPIQRLEAPVQLGVLDTALATACGEKLRWKTTYGGVPGAITYLNGELTKQLDRVQPHCVVLGYGQLDVVLTRAKTEPGIFEENLRKILAVIAAHPSKPTIFLLTCPPFRAMHSWTRDEALRAQGGANAVLERHVNQVTRRIGHELHLPVLDLARQIQYYGADRIINGQGSVPNGAGRVFVMHFLAETLGQWSRANLLRDAAAEQAEARARALLQQAAGEEPAAAARTLVAAAIACPYLAETAVRLDEAQAPTMTDHAKEPLPSVNTPPYIELTLLGDSVTALSLGQSVHTGAFEQTLNALCGNTALWSVVNRAQGGETVPGAMQRITAVLDECQPQYITISYGLNDMGFTEAKQRPAFFTEQLRALVTLICNHPSHPQVLLLTSTPFRDDVHFWKSDPVFVAKGGLNAVLNTEINAATRRLAVDLDLPLFDMYRLFMAHDHEKLISKDGVHPSTEGVRLLTDTLPKWIAAYTRAHALRDQDALVAESQARALMKQADAEPARARDLLQQAANRCPYLADIFVRLDMLEKK